MREEGWEVGSRWQGLQHSGLLELQAWGRLQNTGVGLHGQTSCTGTTSYSSTGSMATAQASFIAVCSLGPMSANNPYLPVAVAATGPQAPLSSSRHVPCCGSLARVLRLKLSHTLA